MSYCRTVLATLMIAAMTIATPVPARTSGLPATDPAACTIAPRAEFPLGQEGDLTALSPTPTPSIDETGAIPADDGAIAAVTATAAMAIACQNAGDLPRMLAAFSDSWLMGRFDSYDLVFVDRFYDVMDIDEDLTVLRQVHGASLDQARDRLSWGYFGVADWMRNKDG